MPVVLSGSSTQQHSPSQPSVCSSASQTRELLRGLDLHSSAVYPAPPSIPTSPCLHHPLPSVSAPSLFAVRCGGCAQAVSPAELVMRAQAAVFHLRCFTCSVCSCRLRTGDRCVLRDGQLLCAREDYHRCLASPTSSDTGNPLSTMCRSAHVCLSKLHCSSPLNFDFRK